MFGVGGHISGPLNTLIAATEQRGMKQIM